MGMIDAALAAGLAAIGLAAAAPPPPAGGPLEFDGAKLGMSLQQWKALPPPSPDPRATPICEAGAGAAPVTACSYAARFGAYELPEPAPLAGRFLARKQTYRFVGGALTCIEYRSSIDAFDVLVAKLKAQYGRPSRIVHSPATPAGQLGAPSVEVDWTLPNGQVRLVDPSPDPNRLMVRLQARPGPSGCTGAPA